MDENKIVIQQRIGKSIAFIVLSLAIVLILIWTLITEFRGEGSGINYIIMNNEVLYFAFKILVAFSFLFFFAAFIYFIKRVILNQPLLVVDESGVYDNTSMFAVGKMEWEDIEGIYLGYQFGNQFIEIKLRNEKHYFTNKFKRFMVKSNRKHGHEVVCINLSTAKEKVKDVLPKMGSLLEKHKGKNNE